MCIFCCNFAAKLFSDINMKRNIAIIAGGDSSEYEVSLRSAAGIESFLADQKQYTTTIVLLRGNDWKAKVSENEWAEIDKNDSMPAALRSDTSYSELSPPAIMAIFRFMLLILHNFAAKLQQKMHICKRSEKIL